MLSLEPDRIRKSGPTRAASDSGPTYALAEPEKAVLARIAPSDEKAARKVTFNDLYTAIKDDLNPIRVLRNDLAEGRLMPLEAREDPYNNRDNPDIFGAAIAGC